MENKEMKIVNESILDPIQNERCEALFNPSDKSESPVILKSTKDFIFGLLEKFKKEVGINFEYTQAFIVGSSLGFQYKDNSDIDVDVRVNITRDKMKGKFHCIPKNILLPGTAHPINVYVIMDDDPEYDFDMYAENAYDLLTDTWIKQGRLENSDPIPYEHVAGISEFIMDGMALELHRGERDMYELNKYLNINTQKSAITDNERKDAISRKIGDLLIDKDALRLAHSMVLRLERGGFEWDSPFDISIKYVYQDKHYSMNNVIYKYIDQFGYYEKINTMVSDIDKLIRTAKNAIAEVKEQTPETINQAEAQKEVEDEINGLSTERKDQLSAEEFEKATKEAVPEEDEGKVAVAESYTDTELREILIENGLVDSDKNLETLKSNTYIIIESLNEDLTSRTEKAINRKIYKASGNVHRAVSQGLGFLIAGPVGFAVADGVWQNNKEDRDDKTRELHDKIEYNQDAQDTLREIKQELAKDRPNKVKLMKLKAQFGKNIKQAKKEKRNNEPHISLRED